MHDSSPSLQEALLQHRIPLSVELASTYGVKHSCHGIPYLVLPEPHDSFCLTNFLLPPCDAGLSSSATSGHFRENDAEAYARILNTPEAAEGLATPKYRVITVDERREWLKQILARAPSGWCMSGKWVLASLALIVVIRRTEDVESSPDPMMIGTIGVKRLVFQLLSPEENAMWTERERDLPDDQVHWSIGATLDPAFGGQGLARVGLCRSLHVILS
ncbi:hypothetical protein BD324DRAFT_636042, partial [Kockovaella imperatae]